MEAEINASLDNQDFEIMDGEYYANILSRLKIFKSKAILNQTFLEFEGTVKLDTNLTIKTEK